MGEVKELIQNFSFHRILGEVKVLIQNISFHHVLGEVRCTRQVFHLERAGGRCFTNISCYLTNTPTERNVFMI